jgi:peptidoglycan hydrolase-like protein with peptidoglycan-binding domain
MALPVVPQLITVHLGNPKTSARDIRILFTDYIKNVASSEIYPTWPENALRANIYTIVSFALNRVYTEFYRAQGYPFDITSSTAYDQAFVEGRDVFSNISRLVDEQFNDYIVRRGQVQPMFAMYCNGTTVRCNGLSQWGSYYLAKEGYTPYRILQYYYGSDIDLVVDAPVGIARASYPGRFLRLGSIGEEVRTLQKMLLRISRSFPAIRAAQVGAGIFDHDTDRAVREFQRVFGLTADGIVGQETWYRMVSIYNSVKRINELDSEGISASEAGNLYDKNLRRGARGLDVKTVQYYLDFVARFFEDMAPLDADGIFGPRTEEDVKYFQTIYDLVPDGIVGRTTWNLLQNEYIDLYNAWNAPEKLDVFSGYALSQEDTGERVRRVQFWLDSLAQRNPVLLRVSVDGFYGPATTAAVEAFQKRYGVPISGDVGPLTWNVLYERFRELEI